MLRILVLIVGNEMEVIFLFLVFCRYFNMEVFIFLVVIGLIGIIWKRKFVFKCFVVVVIMEFGVWGLCLVYLLLMEEFFFLRIVVFVLWLIERFKEVLLIIVIVFVEFFVILLCCIWKESNLMVVFRWFGFCLVIGENKVLLVVDVLVMLICEVLFILLVFFSYFFNFLLNVWMVGVFLLYNINCMFFSLVVGFFLLNDIILLK